MRYSVVPFFLFACEQDYNVEKIQYAEATPADTSEQVIEELPPQEEVVLEECPDRIWSAIEVAVDETCKDEPQMTPFSAVIEWRMSTFEVGPNKKRHLAPPMVAQLSDDNADGIVDDQDIPDIVLIGGEWYNAPNFGVMRLISGDGSVVHWSHIDMEWNGQTYHPIQHSTPAIGDVDNDGETEIVTILRSDHNTCHYASIDRFGDIKQLNETDTIVCRVNSVSLSDMEGDGTIEAITGNMIFNGEDGSLQGSGHYGVGMGFNWNKDKAFAIDMDGDGLQELVTGNTIYDHLGNRLCSTNSYDGFPAVADIDMDGKGELVVSGNRGVQIYNEDCMPVAYWDLPDDGMGGPPTIADYDGDGIPEIGVASYFYYFVFETDGTLLWQQDAVDGSSNCTGSSVYDFEGDGYAEVVYADERDLFVYSGHNGFIKLLDYTHNSQTTTEYPVIVDVDGDGEVEIVVSDNDGVRVVGSANGSWVPARKVWNQYAYHITNINDDLSIPSPSVVNWPEYNNFRSGDIRLNNGEGANYPDAIPLLVDTCNLQCEQDLLQVILQLGNQGLTTFSSNIPISLYSEENGMRVLIQTKYTESIIFSGRSNPGMVFSLDANSVPEGKLWVVVDDDGQGGGVLEECNESNNEMLIETGLCPPSSQ